jgi:hypothetical protein
MKALDEESADILNSIIEIVWTGFIRLQDEQD